MVKLPMIIAKDHVVGFDYTLTDIEGQILDSSGDSGPLSYLHGTGNIISGLEKALEGRTEGSAFKVLVPAAEAYGLRDEHLVITVPLDRFQGAGSVQEGMRFEAETPDGPRLVAVTKVDADMVTVDANHPLAGQDLNFDVKVVLVRAASPEELEHGHPHTADCGADCGAGCGDSCCSDGDVDCGAGCDADSSSHGCCGCR